MDFVKGINSGDVTVRVEGEIQESRPDGVRPRSIFVTYNSPGVKFQFSILEFHHNGSHYLPSKSGNKGSSYTLSVDRSNLNDAAFDEPDIGDKSLAELPDDRICGLLYPCLFHAAVLPAYNEWRYRRGLEWGETWGESSRKDDYRPYSIR